MSGLIWLKHPGLNCQVSIISILLLAYVSDIRLYDVGVGPCSETLLVLQVHDASNRSFDAHRCFQFQQEFIQLRSAGDGDDPDQGLVVRMSTDEEGRNQCQVVRGYYTIVALLQLRTT